MTTAQIEAPVEERTPERRPRRQTMPREQTDVKRQPPHAVILHNDDINGFDYVIGVIRKVFRYDEPKAKQLTLEAHVTGRSVVWSGSLEVAELKADQIKSCGPDPNMRAKGALPLRVTIEPLPG